MNLADLLEDEELGAVEATRTRYAAQSVSASGVVTRGNGSDTDIVGVFQPVTGLDLQNLPEGRRADEVSVFFTESELRVRDWLTVGADIYEVDSVKTRSEFSETWYRAVISRRSKP